MRTLTGWYLFGSRIRGVLFVEGSLSGVLTTHEATLPYFPSAQSIRLRFFQRSSSGVNLKANWDMIEISVSRKVRKHSICCVGEKGGIYYSNTCCAVAKQNATITRDSM